MAREEKGNKMGAYEDKPPGNSSNDESSSLAARRARLRGSLAKAALPHDAFTNPAGDLPAPQAAFVQPAELPAQKDLEPNMVATPWDQLFKSDVLSAETAAPVPPIPMPVQPPPAEPPAPPVPTPVQLPPAEMLLRQTQLSPEAMSVLISISEATHSCADNLAVLKEVPAAQPIPPSVQELIANIDSAMNACALNLSALQKVADEQTDVLKGLSETLRNQTLYEIGLNLNSLTESLSAALEPMKATGELVPAIDQLVAAMEAKVAVDNKYSPDQLVMNLSDQLSGGTIDPWTFKCAYMAIFPADHPADLLRRLVELLGTQRLSGDLFRAAYEAVQAAEPPTRTTFAPRADSLVASAATFDALRPMTVDDPETKAQLEALREANEQMRRVMEEREGEFEQLLAAKDMELQEAQEMLNSRYEEFNTRYAELTEALNKREEEYQNLLDNKDMELTEKESELGLLRRQMEELRSQTEDMVKELQVQMTDIRIAKEAVSQSPTVPNKPQGAGSFFDTSPKPSALFDAAPAAAEKPFFATEPAAPARQPQQPAPQPAPQPVSQPLPQPAQQPVQLQVPQAVSQQARAAQPSHTTTFSSGAGSYGSGVRAQVFEVIVRQALAGAPWREICAGPMQVNNISPEEVETEVKRRQAMLNK